MLLREEAMFSIYSAVREFFVVNIETMAQPRSSYVEEWAMITLVYIDDRRVINGAYL